MRLLVILLSALVVFLSFLLLRKHQADLSKEQLQLSLLQRDIEDIALPLKPKRKF